MPAIVEKPPTEVREELTALRGQLSREIPKKADDNLLVATWNIREFGGLTDKWTSAQTDSPKRDLRSLACIAEIVSRFDVVAIQEAQADIRALRHLLKALGDDYSVILTDAVEDDEGDNERLAGIPQAALDRQFARTPYAVAFKRGDATFILITLHVIWSGSGPEDLEERSKELTSIAAWLRSWAEDVNSWDQNLICLGDFNIDRKDGPLWQAFTSTGLTVPEPLMRPRLIGDDKPLKGFYDQIAWFTEDGGKERPLLAMSFDGEAGLFDWSDTALASSGLSAQQKSFRISDHFPLWVEFSL